MTANEILQSTLCSFHVSKPLSARLRAVPRPDVAAFPPSTPPSSFADIRETKAARRASSPSIKKLATASIPKWIQLPTQTSKIFQSRCATASTAPSTRPSLPTMIQQASPAMGSPAGDPLGRARRTLSARPSKHQFAIPMARSTPTHIQPLAHKHHSRPTPRLQPQMTRARALAG